MPTPIHRFFLLTQLAIFDVFAILFAMDYQFEVLSLLACILPEAVELIELLFSRLAFKVWRELLIVFLLLAGAGL